MSQENAKLLDKLIYIEWEDAGALDSAGDLSVDHITEAEMDDYKFHARESFEKIGAEEKQIENLFESLIDK